MFEGLRTKYQLSHQWERAAHVREFRAGLLPQAEVCDADFLLRAAADFHGVDYGVPCPVCEQQLRLTYWVYGEVLGRKSGSARSLGEIAELLEGLRQEQPSAAEFSVHAVEVCPSCRWNHLLEAVTVY